LETNQGYTTMHGQPVIKMMVLLMNFAVVSNVTACKPKITC